MPRYVTIKGNLYLISHLDRKKWKKNCIKYYFNSFYLINLPKWWLISIRYAFQMNFFEFWGICLTVRICVILKIIIKIALVIKFKSVFLYMKCLLSLMFFVFEIVIISVYQLWLLITIFLFTYNILSSFYYINLIW